MPTCAGIACLSWLCTHTVIPKPSPVELLHKDAWDAPSTLGLCSVSALGFSVQLFSWHWDRWPADGMDTERYFSWFFILHKSDCGVLRLLVPKTSWLQVDQFWASGKSLCLNLATSIKWSKTTFCCQQLWTSTYLLQLLSFLVAAFLLNFSSLSQIPLFVYSSLLVFVLP